MSILEWAAALFTFVVFVLLTPILLSIYLLFILYRTLVALEIKRRYSHLGPKSGDYPCGQLLTSVDLLMNHGNIHGINIVQAQFILEGKVLERERVKHDVLNLLVDKIGQDRKICFPKFRMFPDSFLGLFFWNYDRHFDIDNHVRCYDKEEIIVGLENYRRVIEEISNEPIQSGNRIKPGWEIVIIPFKTDENSKQKCCIFLRFHHVYSNGIAMFRVLMDTLFTNDDQREKMFESVTKQQEKSGKTDDLFKKIMFSIKAFIFMPLFVISSAPLKGDKEHALHRKEMANHSKMTWSDNFALEDLRPIRKATNCSVNDIFLSCVIGALRRYYETNKLKLPSKITFGIPVSMEKLFEPPNLQNKQSCLLIKLPMDIEDPVKRLKAVNKITNKKKESPEYLLNLWFTNLLLNKFPYFMIRKLLVETVDVTALASSFPGPNYQPLMFGLKVTELISCVPNIAKTGLGFVMMTMNGKVTMSVTVDKNLEPNQERLNDIVKYFMDEVNHLYDIFYRKLS